VKLEMKTHNDTLSAWLNIQYTKSGNIYEKPNKIRRMRGPRAGLHEMQKIKQCAAVTN
jgi:hypothetical protein